MRDNPSDPNNTPNFQAILERATAAQEAAQESARLAADAAKEATAAAMKAAEDKAAAARALELAAAIPEDKESERTTQRAAKKAAVWGMIIGGLVTVSVLVIVYSTRPPGLEFKDNIWTQIGRTLGGLLIVALIVERIIEILVSIWSSSKSDALLQQRDYYEKLQARREKQISELRKECSDAPPPNESRQAEIVAALIAKRQEATEAERHAEIAEKLLVPHGARTRRLAAWTGLAIGVLVSMVGFRLLETLVIIDPATRLRDHYGWFLMVDALLTGAVLAGGSIFIHHLFAVYDNFMNSTKRRARGLDEEKSVE